MRRIGSRVRETLKMEDVRLPRIAESSFTVSTPDLQALIADMQDTLEALNGAALAASKIGVKLQLAIFDITAVNPRHPGRPQVARTVRLNPQITPLGAEEKDVWEGCLSVPVFCAAWCRAGLASTTPVWTNKARPKTARWTVFTPPWCSTKRPPDRQALPHAGTRLQPIWLHLGAVSRDQRCRGRLSIRVFDQRAKRPNLRRPARAHPRLGLFRVCCPLRPRPPRSGFSC